MADLTGHNHAALNYQAKLFVASYIPSEDVYRFFITYTRLKHERRLEPRYFAHTRFKQARNPIR
jgi:hypothetical protein